MSALVDQLRKIQSDAVTAPEKEQVGRYIAAVEAAEKGELRTEKIRSFALGRAHAHYRAVPNTQDWQQARAWFSPDTTDLVVGD